MKSNYATPFAKILLCEEDVITSSVSVLGEDNVVFWPSPSRGKEEDFYG